MVEFPDYAKVISKLLTIRGLRKEFQGKNFPIFLRGRTIEFNVALLEDMYESWHTLASKSLDSVDGHTVQVVNKWNRRMKAEEIEERLNMDGEEGSSQT
jgi:hypothetical protein